MTRENVCLLARCRAGHFLIKILLFIEYEWVKCLLSNYYYIIITASSVHANGIDSCS